MKTTKRVGSLLLVLLLCCSTLLCSCEGGEKEEVSQSQAPQVSTEPAQTTKQLDLPKTPLETEEFMLQQIKSQFALSWGATSQTLLGQAKTQDCLVVESFDYTHGRESLESFCQKSEQGEACFFKIANFYPSSESIFFTLVFFDGTLYHTVTLDSSGELSGKVRSFRYLMHYEGFWDTGAVSFDYSYYYLTNDDTITYQQIDRSMYSSVLEEAMLSVQVKQLCGEHINYTRK